MPDYIPAYFPGHTATFNASAPITGGQVVTLTGSRSIAPTSGPTFTVVGVASNDANTGDDVTVFSNGVQRLLTGGPVTAGQHLEAATAGRVVAHVNGTNDIYDIGIALTSGSAGSYIEAKLAR